MNGIYGGTDAALGEYPYVVHLKLTGSTGTIIECSGVLFAANLVITNGNLDKNYVRKHVNRFLVYFQSLKNR